MIMTCNLSKSSRFLYTSVLLARGCSACPAQNKRRFIFRRSLSSRPHPAVDRVIRVGHAEKRGAERLYAGQAAVLGKTDMAEVIQDNLEREKKRHELYNKLVQERRVRPSLLLPLWDVAAFVLGSSTALMGKQAAVACSVAVKEAAVDHYNSQLRELLSETLDDSEELLRVITECRDDELSHEYIAEQSDVKSDASYEGLSQIIKSGYKAAIWFTKIV